MAEVLNKILDGVMLVAIVLAVIVAFDTAKAIKETASEPTSEPVVTETIEPTQVPTETTQPITEPPVTEESKATEPPVILYDVPLSEDLQLHIIGLCEEHHIDPAIILAMCFRESSYNPSAIGDGGNSLGLMQIQPRWNMALMEQLGCLDLLDPYQNVTVGIAVLAGQLERYEGDLAKALVAYNQGHFNGTVTQYAKEVLAKAEELKVVAECMRLQTVPDWYEFPVSDSQAYKMLGNGWTVEVIAHLIRATQTGELGEEQLDLFKIIGVN